MSLHNNPTYIPSLPLRSPEPVLLHGYVIIASLSLIVCPPPRHYVCVCIASGRHSTNHLVSFKSHREHMSPFIYVWHIFFLLPCPNRFSKAPDDVIKYWSSVLERNLNLCSSSFFFCFSIPLFHYARNEWHDNLKSPIIITSSDSRNTWNAFKNDDLFYGKDFRFNYMPKLLLSFLSLLRW